MGWLDAKAQPDMREWIKKQLVGKMGKDYSFDVRSVAAMLRGVCDSHLPAGTTSGI